MAGRGSTTARCTPTHSPTTSNTSRPRQGRINLDEQATDRRVVPHFVPALSVGWFVALIVVSVLGYFVGARDTQTPGWTFCSSLFFILIYGFLPTLFALFALLHFGFKSAGVFALSGALVPTAVILFIVPSLLAASWWLVAAGAIGRVATWCSLKMIGILNESANSAREPHNPSIVTARTRPLANVVT